MTLTVENGTGLANADALISLADVNAYHTGRGNAAWSGTDDAKEAAIRRASFFLSNSYSWKGSLVKGRDQALAWPRHSVQDGEGWHVQSDAVPLEVADATAEIALRELVDPGSMTPDIVPADKVKSEGLGPLKTEYANVSTSVEASRPVLLIVRDLIGGLLANGGGNALIGRAERA